MLLLRNRDVVGNGELATVCQSIQFVFKEIICIGITSITVSILDVDNSKAQIEKIHNIVARRRKNVTKTVTALSPKQGHTKETITKEKRNNKNTMSESVRTECEKSPDRHEETDKAFEEIFWCAGMRKAGKKNAASAFRTQFREWRKTTRGTASEFATMLAEDIACRNGKQFGFDRLLPSSYLNGQRWNDEKPETIQPQSKPSSAITVSKTGYVFFDR